MELSGEQRVKIANFLIDKKCPICGGSYHADPFTYKLTTSIPGQRGSCLEKELVVCTCQSCQNVALFNASGMDIF